MKLLASMAVSAIITLLLTTAMCRAEVSAVKTIPLDQIWGYDTPGTRDIRELEPKRDTRNMSHKEYVHGSIVNQIAAMLHRVPKETEKAGSAFIVRGTGKEALKNARDVFLDRYKNHNKPEGSMPKDTDLTLVFYSYTCGWHVQIESVEQTPTVITIRYQFVAQPIMHSGATRFALIPIGKLSEGLVEVIIEQIPPIDVDGNLVEPMHNPDRYVCESCSVSVK